MKKVFYLLGKGSTIMLYVALAMKVIALIRAELTAIHPEWGEKTAADGAENL